MNKRPSIGVGVMVINPGFQVLLGKRQGSHGSGEWSLPGGHLEWNESFGDCCRREVEEETGIVIGEIEPISFTNDIFEKESLHYVTLFFKTRLSSYIEPDKCVEWGWFYLHNLPDPLFLPLHNFLIEERMALIGITALGKHSND